MNKRFLVWALMIMLAVLMSDYFMQHQLDERHVNEQKADLSQRVAALRARIENEITENLLLVHGAANFISVSPDLDQDTFGRYARGVLANHGLLKNLAAAPDFVIRYVYPLEGNEAILGVDYRDLAGQWEQVRKVREKKEMVVAGPLKLIQGGSGLIGRAPVFVRHEEETRFWGIVSSAIDADRLFENVGLSELTDMEVALRGVDGKGEEGAVFWGDESFFEPGADVVVAPVHFPSGTWVLAARPMGGIDSTHPFSNIVHLLFALFAIAALVGSYREVRDRQRVEAARASLTEAQSIAHMGSWEHDLAKGRVWWSQEAYRIFGKNPQTFSPTLDSYLDLVHPEDRQVVLAAYEHSFRDRAPFSLEHRIIQPDGPERHVLSRGVNEYAAGGRLVRSSGTVLDITELKRAELVLTAREAQLRAMADASYDAFIMIDAEDTIHYWSTAAERMFGWSRQEAMGSKLHSMIVLPRYREAAARGLKTFATTGEGLVLESVQEFEALRKDGSTVPVERTVTAFQSEGRFYAVSNLRDITERKQAEEKLKAFAERISLASEAGGIGVWEWNVVTGDLLWDRRMLELYQLTEEEFSGSYEAWVKRVHPDDIAQAEAEFARGLDSRDEVKWRFRVLLPDGAVRHIQAVARVHVDQEGKAQRMIGINQDVTRLVEHQQELKRLATTDGLTGLNNRRSFTELAQRELERSQRYSRPLSLIMFDADHFKAVNDTYGHAVGDDVLRALAALATDVVRDVDILGRVGGEEFAVVLPETEARKAAGVAERLREVVEAARVQLENGEAVSFTISLGVAEVGPDDGVDELMKAADSALYQAKENGRNRVELA